MRPAIRSGLIYSTPNSEINSWVITIILTKLSTRKSGSGSWAPMVEGLRWLPENNFQIAVAGELCGKNQRKN